MIFSERDLSGKKLLVMNGQGSVVWKGKLFTRSVGKWGAFNFHYPADLTFLRDPGEYTLTVSGEEKFPEKLIIREDPDPAVAREVLGFITQQRCGYNPFFDEVCHFRDGRSAYGPMPEGSYVDVGGGWHDAGDDLRYLMTSSTTAGRLLMAYEESPSMWGDSLNALGQKMPNGIPDILDEAKWGLDWMLKMHPGTGLLYHQVGDDRDHTGFKFPHRDSSDYGWGTPNGYRTAYFADGKPQGLGKYQNTSTGIANLAGRYAAVMARAHRIWKNDLGEEGLALVYLKAGREVFAMGLEQPGCQEGTPNRASYRYHESSWTDDMEWGAAELYLSTGEHQYLEQAKDFARQTGTDGWMGADTARHYEEYPFMNTGHYVLFTALDEKNSEFRDSLASWYRTQLEGVVSRTGLTPYGVGHPFIWCSNNLASALIIQEGLYEKMTGDLSFRDLAVRTMDWLWGRNPWGVSQIIGLGQTTSVDYHSSTRAVSGRHTPGGLLDGPLYLSTFKLHEKYIQLYDPDEYAKFQNEYLVFHDDVADFATNEPTLDGSAEFLLAWVIYGGF